MADAYPLAWPAAWPRTKAGDRRRAKFNERERVYHPPTPSSPNGRHSSHNADLTVAGATSRVLAELAKFGVERRTVIISGTVYLAHRPRL